MGYDVLVVDDEKDIRELIEGVLSDEGYKVRTACDGVWALNEIKKRQPNLVILDVWLSNGERDGLKILETIKLNHPYVPVVMISGHATVETAVSAIKNGAYDFLEKPFKTERLLMLVERAIDSARLRQENDELKLKSGIGSHLVGNSSAMNQIYGSIQEASQSLCRVLIEGAIGTGKQAISREIHKQSQRSKGPFVIFNCSSIHPDHLEAELFGTDILGLSDDVPRKVGCLEQANGGTLYLANVEFLTLNTQSRLSRYLQDGCFYRLGGQTPVKSDVRIIGSTLQNSKFLMDQGNLLPDLFYRLSVIRVTAPSLKERASDIPTLAKHFMKQLALSRGSMPRRLSEETLIVLQAYDWPGNLNQLRHVMEWILIMGGGNPSDLISPSMLPLEILNNSPFSNNWQNKTAEIVVMPLREAREAFEREYLLAQIHRFEGNISQTARFIGMERSALHRKLKSLGVSDFKG